MTTNTGKYKEEIWLNIKNREFFPSSLKTRDVHVLNFFQFSLPPFLSLTQRQKLLSANSQMLKVFKTFVATASPSKALCCISFFPTFRWSAKCDPQLVSFHWNIGKLGEEEGCSGLRAGFNQFLSSFHHFLIAILLFTFYLHILTSEEMRLNVVWRTSCCKIQGSRTIVAPSAKITNSVKCLSVSGLWSPWLSWSCLIAVVNVFKVMFPNHLGQMSQRVSKVGRTNRQTVIAVEN